MSTDGADYGVYVHVPWCRRRCPYCAFYVERTESVAWDDFVRAVLAEREQRRAAFPGTMTTVFLGGGTPSQMPTAHLATLLRTLVEGADTEVSAECNPEDCTPEWLDGAIAAGVNRVSLGMQTFQPDFARLLNRACTVDRAVETARLVADAPLRSWSVDLIFALPGQTLSDLDRDLDAIDAIDAPHVALYGLTYEPGTPFTRARDRGRFTEADEDLWRAMYDRIVERLRAMGLERYEVSNFARPGLRSRHNQLYWTDAPYMGLGPSAHGYLPDGRRYNNRADAATYLQHTDPTEQIETPDPEQAAIDLIVSGLRSIHGVDLDHLSRRTGLTVPQPDIQRAVREGLALLQEHRLTLTDAGYPVCDALCSHLTERLTPAR